MSETAERGASDQVGASDRTPDAAPAGPAAGVRPEEPRRLLPLVAALAAALCSLGGNAISLVALPIIALDLTGSPLWAGVAGVFATVPLVIGGAFGGVLVDRFGYRASSIAADLASGVAVLAVPVLHATVGLPFWALLALAFVGGLLDPPGDTAKTSLTPDLAALARVPIARAAGAQSAVQRTATMVGAGTAGVLIGLSGPMVALVADSVGFGLAALLVLLFVPAAHRGRATGPAAEDDAADVGARDSGGFLDGLRFVAHSPLLRAIVLLVTLTNAIDAAGITVLKPLYASEVLDDRALLGFMVGTFAAGALVGSAVFGAVGHRWSSRWMFAACFVLAGVPPYLAMALGAPAQVLLPVLAASGLAAGALNPMISTAMYGLIPDGMRARVFGVTTAGVTATMPLGAFLGGAAAQSFGLGPTLAVCALVYAVLGASPLVLRSFDGLAVGAEAAQSPEAAPSP